MNKTRPGKQSAKKVAQRDFDQFVLGDQIRKELMELVELLPASNFGQAKMTKVTVVRYAVHQLWLRFTQGNQQQATASACAAGGQGVLDLDQLDNAMKESDEEDRKVGRKRRGLHVDPRTGNACAV